MNIRFKSFNKNNYHFLLLILLTYLIGNCCDRCKRGFEPKAFFR